MAFVKIWVWKGHFSYCHKDHDLNSLSTSFKRLDIPIISKCYGENLQLYNICANFAVCYRSKNICHLKPHFLFHKTKPMISCNLKMPLVRSLVPSAQGKRNYFSIVVIILTHRFLIQYLYDSMISQTSGDRRLMLPLDESWPKLQHLDCSPDFPKAPEDSHPSFCFA